MGRQTAPERAKHDPPAWLVKGRKIVERTGLRHVAIIMDGNGRWAQERGRPRLEGHRAGYEAVDRTVTAARRMGLKALTLYAFSTENWSRPPQEVQGLFALLLRSVREQRQRLLDNGIRFETIGVTSALPEPLASAVDELREVTAENDRLVLTVALNYGARDEITRAVQHLVSQAANGNLTPEDVNEQLLSRELDTGRLGLSDPDLIIRTAGERRLSNFLLWQAAYSELWTCPIAWPEFGPTALLQAVETFAMRERRFGSLTAH